MTEQTYPKALSLVLAHEGGWVNHKDDPGGPTMKGVTQKVYDAYRVNKGLDKRTVRKIAPSELQAIYKAQYWDAIQGDRLPAGIDYAVFDYSVNSGADRAVRELQRQIGAGVDGQVGEETIRLANKAAEKDEEGLITAYCGARMKFVKKLRTWKTFGKGWTRRIMGDFDGFQEGDRGVIDFAIMMARGDLTYPIAKAIKPAAIGEKSGEEAGKAEPADIAITKTSQGKGVVGTVVGLGTAAAGTVSTVAQQIQEAGDATTKAAAAAVNTHAAAHKLFGIFDETTLLLLTSGGLVVAAAGCAFFGYHYLKSQREKAA